MAELERAFPQYRRFRLLAETSFSVVFSVMDRRGGPPLALKLCPSIGSDDSLARRFAEEVRILAQQRSAHLVTLADQGSVQLCLSSGMIVSFLFCTTNLCSAGSVAQRLPLLSLPQRVAIIEQFLDGLGYLHAIRVAHCDIKPANLFLAALKPLQVQIGDFGLATEGGRPEGGTPGYIAPERLAAQGLPPAATGWLPSDQFAAGATLYRILSVTEQAIPVLQDDWERMGNDWARIVAAHQLRPLRPLRIPELPGVPCGQVDWVVARMMAVDPAARFPSIQDSWLSLRAALRADGVPF